MDWMIKYLFNANGTTLYKDLRTLYNLLNDETGTWAISSAGKIIINDGTIDVSEADLSCYDCSTLVITGN